MIMTTGPSSLSSAEDNNNTNTNKQEIIKEVVVVQLRHDEQVNEEHYDERNEANDDLEKGKIKFSNSKLYGRETELNQLQTIYNRLTGGTTTTTTTTNNYNRILQQAETTTTDYYEVDPDVSEELGVNDDGGGGDNSGTPTSASSSSQAVFIPAYSGTGKSALVHEFIRRLEEEESSSSSSTTSRIKPRFISGKYNELFKSESYSTIADGVGKFFLSLLHSSNEEDQYELLEIQNQLTDTLGSYGSILLDIIPNLNHVLQENPLLFGSGNASMSGENRSQVTGGRTQSSSSINNIRNKKNNINIVKHVFRNLIKTLCTKEHPLILFLDDIQWIDEGTFELLSTLLKDVNLKYFMFIGAYRSNEVTTEQHPISILLKDLISKRGNSESSSSDGGNGSGDSSPLSPIVSMELSDLTIDDIGEFIIDTLNLRNNDNEDDEEEDENEEKEEPYVITEKVQSLITVIYTKTLGNIFFTMQAMEELVRKNVLYYDVMFFTWEWNLSQYEMEQLLSNDVIAMVQSKLQHLKSLELQRILLVSSYIRSTINPFLLEHILKAVNSPMSQQDIIKFLDMAVNEYGLLLKKQNVTVATTTIDDHNEDDLDSSSKLFTTIEYTFAHDRIQEAAQTLIAADSTERNDLIYQIAKELDLLNQRSTTTSTTDEPQQQSQNQQGSTDDWMLYSAVHHMNSLPIQYLETVEGGCDVVSIQLTKMNIRAAKLAINRSAFQQAVELLRSGVSSLHHQQSCGTDGSSSDGKKRTSITTSNSIRNIKWLRHYDLCIELYTLLLETEFSIGNFVEAQKAVEEVLHHAVSLSGVLIAQFYDIEISTSNKDRNFVRAIDLGVGYLTQHGIQLPVKPTDRYLMKERIALQWIQGRRDFLELLEESTMDDYSEQIMRLLSQLSHACMVSGNTKLCILVNITAQKLSWEKGMNEYLPSMLPHYASQLRKQGKLNEACRIAFAAEEMLHKICEGPAWVRGIHVCRGAVIGMRVPYATNIDVCHEVHRCGMSCGDTQFGILAAMVYSLSYYCAGFPINALFEAKLLYFEDEAKSHHLSPTLIVTFQVFRQTLLNLQGRNTTSTSSAKSSPTLFKGVAVDEDKALSEFTGNTKQQTLRDISVFRLMLATIYNDEDVMIEMMNRLSNFPDFDLCVPRQHLRDVFMGLAAFRLARKCSSNKTSTTRQDVKNYLKIGRDKMKFFQKLARVARSANAPPIVLCLRAEERPTKTNFDTAIHACSSYGLDHLTAIMSESYGEFLMDSQTTSTATTKKQQRANKNMADVAQTYLIDAYWLYSDWGAMGKARAMKLKYSFLHRVTRKEMSNSLNGSQRSFDVIEGMEQVIQQHRTSNSSQ